MVPKALSNNRFFREEKATILWRCFKKPYWHLYLYVYKLPESGKLFQNVTFVCSFISHLLSIWAQNCCTVRERRQAWLSHVPLDLTQYTVLLNDSSEWDYSEDVCSSIEFVRASGTLRTSCMFCCFKGEKAVPSRTCWTLCFPVGQNTLPWFLILFVVWFRQDLPFLIVYMFLNCFAD